MNDGWQARQALGLPRNRGQSNSRMRTSPRTTLLRAQPALNILICS